SILRPTPVHLSRRIIVSNENYKLELSGLLGSRTVQSLLDIQRRHRPDAFFLSKTHLNDAKAEELKRKLGMDDMICEPSVDGRTGGLLLVWKEVRIYFWASTLDFIYVIVEEPNGDLWRMTGIYGEPNWDSKDRTYRLLRDLHVQSSLPWTILGDFNEILLSSDKEGGAPRHQSRLKAFQYALSDFSLEDVGYIGDKFTWLAGGGGGGSRKG
uniref:Endonuclease/exonuclease/phosphatase domain-containing protein n=2 Tax=Aegilops tauschii subsp. strangulata TaxID=200361 RepID=A0A453SQF7_AEGTS